MSLNALLDVHLVSALALQLCFTALSSFLLMLLHHLMSSWILLPFHVTQKDKLTPQRQRESWQQRRKLLYGQFVLHYLLNNHEITSLSSLSLSVPLTLWLCLVIWINFFLIILSPVIFGIFHLNNFQLFPSKDKTSSQNGSPHTSEWENKLTG